MMMFGLNIDATLLCKNPDFSAGAYPTTYHRRARASAVTLRSLSEPFHRRHCSVRVHTERMYALTLGKSDWPNLGRSIFQRGQRTRDLLRGKYSSLVRSATKSIPNDSLGTAHDRTGYPPCICRSQCDATPEASPWHRFWLFWYTYTCHLTY